MIYKAPTSIKNHGETAEI